MDVRELHRQFKTAAWGSMAAIDAFVAEAGVLPPDEVLRLLSTLSSKGGDAREHRDRCVAWGKLADKQVSKELFGPYLKALKAAGAAADMQLMSTLAPLIPKVNNVAGHVDLCALLKSNEVQLRRVTGHALKQIGGTTVFKTLTDLCGEPSFAGRMEAIDVLVAIGRQHAVPALGAVLQVGTIAEKLHALSILADPETMSKDRKGAIDAISIALRDDAEKVSLQAISAFASLSSEEDFFEHIGSALDSPSLGTVRAAIEAMKKYSSPRAIDAIDRKLRMGPAVIRLAALGTLEAIGKDVVIPPVVGALNHKQIAVRTRAGEVLTNLALAGKVDLARTILWLLRSRDVNVRRMAVDIAKKVGDPSGELAPRLLRYLRDEDWWVRERVMDALVAMAGKQLTRHLVAYLQDPSDIVRRYAVDALERVRDPAAVGALVRAFQSDADWWVRERAIAAVAALGDPRTIPYVIDVMNKEPELQPACIDALAAMKARAAAPHVAALAAQPDADLRLRVIQALGVFDDPTTAAAVEPLQQDGDHRVRSAARELLLRWNLAASQAVPVASTKALGVLDKMLLALAQHEGDDLILVGGQRPYMKKVGKVVPLSQTALTAEQVRSLLTTIITPVQIADIEHMRDVDFSYDVKSEGLRFRANIFGQLPGLSAVFRIVKNRIPVIEELGLPPVVRTFGDLKNGLILVGGPTGSGKSTTLAGVIDYINRTSSRHIITLEDPIEVVHEQKKCLVNQREIGTHTLSFDNALRATLREDPDVILVGEMRDYATIQFAVSAAETGHLVFGTLHTVSVDTSVDRLVNAFPAGQQPQVRSLLADSLRAVMCQYLLKRKDGQGRVLAVEIMINNDAISNLIRKGKTFQIPSVIATGRDAGMQSMDSDIERLLKGGIITAEDAYAKAANKKNFEIYIEGLSADGKEARAAKDGGPGEGGAPPGRAAPVGGPVAGRPVMAGTGKPPGGQPPPAAAAS